MLNRDTLMKAYKLMMASKAMSETYDTNRTICNYVHSSSRGHEAIQIATGLQLHQHDWVSPYYRDDAMMMAMGFEPYQLMLQLLGKKDDPFSGGRSYYCHASNAGNGHPGIIHQSSATGMQAIPTTGIAQGLRYIELNNLKVLNKGHEGENPIVVCSMGDGAVTEGEVSEAWQFAVLKRLPIIYLVQDNQWSISASADEFRAMNAFEYAEGFKGMKRLQCDGSDFLRSYETMQIAIEYARTERLPVLVHAKVPLLGHHTSGVRKEFYRSREDLLRHGLYDPIPKLRLLLTGSGFNEFEINETETVVGREVGEAFDKAQLAADPDVADLEEHIYAPTPATHEVGIREPWDGEKIMMVDAALHAIEEIMREHPECIFYGQDVGKRLGGVFREAATLAEKFGDNRVFNTAIQEAYIVGSTAGLSAVGIKPIVEVQFGDYVYPAINQLVNEISRSNYLTRGKFPIQMVLRIPVGPYDGGGPYHSGSIESMLLTIKGIKIAYPSNAADMKGLMKAAFYDPNPVIMLEHKGLYWSKVTGTDAAKTIEPSSDYVLPLGKAAIALMADDEKVKAGDTVCIVTYGMGVHIARNAAKEFDGNVEVVDLRSLYPLDEELIFAQVKKHGKVIVLSEEQQSNSFAESLSLRISNACYHFLDARVEVLGALDLPAVPINIVLEKAMLPTVEKLNARIKKLLAY